MRIKLPHITRILILAALALTISGNASASALSGKVAEVIDGSTITLVSLNKSLKVRLLAIAPPEKNQPYADAARQHLSDLILGKYVVVRYTGLGEGGYLNGRILLEQSDINAQMLRDGVAWYYAADESELAERDRQIYRDSEKAARDERRGLWQDGSPTAPWDFRRAQLARLNTSSESLPRMQSSLRREKPSGLSSVDMMGGVLRPGSTAGKPTFKPISPHALPGAWVRFESENRQFSILVPSDGVEVTEPVWNSHGKIVEAHYVIGTKDGVAYALIWVKEPNDYSTDIAAADGTVGKLIGGMNHSIEKGGQSATITALPTGDLKLAGYAGRQYNLRGGLLSGVLRVLSRQVGDDRQEFVLCVISVLGSEPSGDQFLNSFKIRGN